MELIRTPVVPMITPTTENLVNGEIVNINNGESIGVVKNGFIIDIIKNSSHRMLDDEAVSMSSDIEYSNSIGYFDKDGNVLSYKIYGVIVDMNNSDCDGCVSSYTDTPLDIEDFIKTFLGFNKGSKDNSGKATFTMNNFYYLYKIVDGKILFLISMGEFEGSYKAFLNDITTIKFGSGIYNEDMNNEFTFKHYMLFNSISWLLYKSTNISHALTKMDNDDLSEFYYRIMNNTWINHTFDIERFPMDSHISKFKISHDTITPSEFEGADNTYFCLGYVCGDASEKMMYLLNDTLKTTGSSYQVKTLIEIM